jgi:hypothetical protein
MEYEDERVHAAGRQRERERGRGERSVTAIDDDAADSISIPVAARRYIAPRAQ